MKMRAETWKKNFIEKKLQIKKKQKIFKTKKFPKNFFNKKQIKKKTYKTNFREIR